MVHSENTELIQVEKLIEEGKLEEASKFLDDFERKQEVSRYERISFYTLRSLLASYRAERDEHTKYAEKAYQESQGLEDSLLLLDVNIQMANNLVWQGKTNESEEFIKKSEVLIEKLSDELTTKLIKRRYLILWIKATKYRLNRKLEKSKEYLEQAFSLLKKTDLKLDLAFMYFHLGANSWLTGDLDHALEYSELSKSLFKDFNLKRLVQNCNMQLGTIYSMKGELDQSLNHYEEALEFAQKEDNYDLISGICNNIGLLYQEKGDYNHALQFLEKSITLAEEIGTAHRKFAVLDSIFHLSLAMNNLEQGQQYLNRMEQITVQQNELPKQYEKAYSINKAIYLKNSPRALNRGKAEEMLKELIEEGIPEFQVLINALLNLSDLLLFELRATSEPEILEELNFYIGKLFETVKNSRSYSLLAETYLLQAKLSLITLDMKKARKFLIKAQEIADKYGLTRLAIKISNEHDDLLRKLDLWEEIKESNAPLSTRINLALPSKQIERMIQKREISVSEISNEEPIFLLIISEGGIPIFSQSFGKGKNFEDHLFGGFLSAVNSFMNEKFSEGLDRVMFGEYTLLLISISPFFICYIFKGQSYSAQQRVGVFVEKMRNDDLTWETFNKFYQLNKEVQLKDVPTLQPLIKEIFEIVK